MGHIHSVYDTDNHFQVDGITRVITNVSTSKVAIVQHDHNSERFTFEIPRYIEGHDMLQCDVVQVHWRNGSASGVYNVGDFQASPADENNVVICSWLISKKATQSVGALTFLLRFACTSEGNPEYVWNTAIHTKINVMAGMYNTSEPEEGDDGGDTGDEGDSGDDGGDETDPASSVLGVAVLGSMKLA